MSRHRPMLAAVLALLTATSVVGAQAGPPPAQRGQRPPAQQPAQRPQTPPRQPQQTPQQIQQQQQQHQQMMAQMQETVQRMTQLQQRAHQLAQGTQQQLQARARVTEQERLMLRTCEALDQQAQQMKGLAERTQDMIRSRDFQRDRDMQRDMDRLRQHLNTMASELDGSLQLMERLQQRLHTPPTP